MLMLENESFDSWNYGKQNWDMTWTVDSLNFNLV